MPGEAERRQCTENIMSEDYGDFILEDYFPEEVEMIPENYCSQAVNSRYLSFYVPKSMWTPLNYGSLSYGAIPKLFTPQDSSSLTVSGIARVRESALGLTGEGVLIGIIDTGIDYRNPVFCNPDKSTRIAAIWDQTIQDGTLPPGLSYGSEYRMEQINEALRSATPFSVVPSRDTEGHGTFLAGIAAGSDRPEAQFIGAAPKSMLAIVKLKPAKQYLRDFFAIQPNVPAYQENDIMLAVAYLQRLKTELDMPLVVLCSMGTNWGSHTGLSPLSQTLDMLLARPGVSAVAPAGNESGLGHHYEGRVEQEGGYRDVEIRVAPDERGFQLELWSRVPDRFTVSILSPGGDYVPQIPARLGENQRIRFPLEGTVVDVSYRFLEVRANSLLVVMRFLTPAPGVWTVRVYSSYYVTGIFNMWLPCQGFIREETSFLDPNPDTTLTVPSATERLLTVGAYNHNTSGIYIRSGRGYTTLGTIKPDLAAPGVDVYGPGLNGQYIRRSGTSVAAAIAAGAASCLLEWGVVRRNRPFMNNNLIRAILIQGAGRNPNLTYPNREWGWGSLDLYHAIDSLS